MQRGGLVVRQIGPGRSPIGEHIMRGELVFGEAACSGDSGGPAFSETTGALVAIASRVGNGTEPTLEEPAAFCVGENADDVYTDFTPAADVVTRAFAAAGASPVLEDSVAPANEGELASANLEVSGATKRVRNDEATTGGCSASPIAASMPLAPPLAILLTAWLAMRIILDRKRTRPR
jgi:secreted trypsin-like serine protease